MSEHEWRWELRRRSSGELVDRSPRLAWLELGAPIAVKAAGMTKSRSYEIVHAPSGTVVGVWGGSHNWEVDTELARRLEPSER